MNLPQLPTDNLYKFIALSGLVVLVVGEIPSWILLRDAQREALVATTELEKLELELDYHEELIAQLRRNLGFRPSGAKNEEDEFEEWLASKPKISNDKRSAVRSATKELDKRLLELRIKFVDTKAGSERVKQLKSEAKFMRSVRDEAWRYGLILAGCGFWLWYWKLQRHQDFTIKNERRRSSL